MRGRVAVVGAGIVGLLVAYEASRRGYEVVVFEESNSLGRGASGHNAGVLHVLQQPFKSWKSRLAVLGNTLYDDLAETANFEIMRMPALLVYKTFYERALAYLAGLYLKRKGFKVRVVSSREVFDLCPDASRDIRGALRVNGYGSVVPLEALSSITELLKDMGVELRFNSKVESVIDSSRTVLVEWANGLEPFDYAVIAAGASAKRLTAASGIEAPRLEYAKGVMVVARLECSAILAPLASSKRSRETKGGGIIPWPDGSTVLGPSFSTTSDPWDTSASIEEALEIIEFFSSILSHKPEPEKVFAGTRIKALPNYDFIVKRSRSGRVVALFGIDSPGFTAAPALAKEVVDLLKT